MIKCAAATGRLWRSATRARLRPRGPPDFYIDQSQTLFVQGRATHTLQTGGGGGGSFQTGMYAIWRTDGREGQNVRTDSWNLSLSTDLLFLSSFWVVVCFFCFFVKTARLGSLSGVVFLFWCLFFADASASVKCIEKPTNQNFIM